MASTGTYTPAANLIVQTTEVDIVARDMITDPIHLVQYDKKYQVIQVKFWKDGEEYTIPENTQISIRYLKPDHTYVYNTALGVATDRKSVYFEVSGQMTAKDGTAKAVAEVMSGDKVLCTATFSVLIDRNPVQEGGIESSDEFKSLQGYVDSAAASASAALVSETNAKASETAAKNSETKAKTSETNAKTSETNAKASETAAKNSETKAANSEANAKTSETNAKASEVAALASQNAAKESETNAKTSETNAKASELKAANSEANAKTSETNAANSASSGANSATEAAKSASQAKTSETNAKASEVAALASQNAADASAKSIQGIEENVTELQQKTQESADAALISETNAKASEVASKASETNAKKSEENALSYKQDVESTAIDVNIALQQAQEASENAQAFAEAADSSAGSILGVEENVTAIQTDITEKQEDISSKYDEIVTKHTEVLENADRVDTEYTEITLLHGEVIEARDQIIPNIDTTLEAAETATAAASQALSSQEAAETSAKSIFGVEENVTAIQTDITEKQEDITEKQEDITVKHTEILSAAEEVAQNAFTVDNAMIIVENTKDHIVALYEDMEVMQESAATSATEASESASSAAQNATTATTKASEAATSATNAEKYMKQAQEVASSLSGALRPHGTITFAKLPALADAEEGDMYNISDEFISTADFEDGAGKIVASGSNVYKTVNGKWDVLAGDFVSSVNGETGNVVLDYTDVGAFKEVTRLENVSLNTILEPGFYYGAGDHGCTGLPVNSLYAFGLIVTRVAYGAIRQDVYPHNTPEQYTRIITNESVPGWTSLSVGVKGNAETTYRGGLVNLTPDNIGLGNVDNTADATKHVDNAKYLRSRGLVNPESGLEVPGVPGLNTSRVYNNGFPVNFGNLLTIYQNGSCELLMEWSGGSNTTTGHLWYRSKSDVGSTAWSEWKRLAYIDDVNSAVSKYLPLTGGTLTGGLSITDFLSMKNGNSQQGVLAFHDDGDGTANYGGELVVTGAGNTYVGGGESPRGLQALTAAGSSIPAIGSAIGRTGENLILSSDQAVYILAGVANDGSGGVAIALSSAGNLIPMKNLGASLGSTNFYWNELRLRRIVNGSPYTSHLENAKGRVALDVATPFVANQALGVFKVTSQNGVFVCRSINTELTLIYTSNEDIAANRNVGTILAHWYETGKMVLDNTLHLLKTTDAAAAADNQPALIIGSGTGNRLEFDENEIMAKAGPTGAGTLYLQNDGGVCSIGANQYFQVQDTRVKISTNPLCLLRNVDIGTADNVPALIVGGEDTATHIAIDADEIQAYGANKAKSTLYLNHRGGIVNIKNGSVIIRDTTIDLNRKALLSKGQSASVEMVGTTGTDGWIVVAQIEVKTTYVNHSLVFQILSRGWCQPIYVSVEFASVNNVDPSQTTYVWGSSYADSVVRIIKVNTSVWRLLVKKNEAYGSVTVGRLDKKLSDNAILVTYPGTLATQSELTKLDDHIVHWGFTAGNSINSSNAVSATYAYYVSPFGASVTKYRFEVYERDSTYVEIGRQISAPKYKVSLSSHMVPLDYAYVGDCHTHAVILGAVNKTISSAYPNAIETSVQKTVRLTPNVVASSTHLNIQCGYNNYQFIGDGSGSTYRTEMIAIGDITDSSKKTIKLINCGAGADAAQTGLQIETIGFAPVYTLRIMGKATATSFVNSSSRKYKKNITPSDPKDSKNILYVEIVTYDYIKEEDGTNCYGVIAEDVYPLIPNVVTLDSEGNPDGVDYSKFVPHLIKMTQMQQEQIDEQAEKIKAQEEEIQMLKAKLENLESFVLEISSILKGGLS